MGDMTKGQRIERGRQARELADSPILRAAFDAIAKDCISQWAKTEASDTDGRERLWHRAKAIAELETQLRRYIMDGAVAAKDIDGAS